MNDFNKQYQLLRQYAQGTITYGVPVVGDTVIVNGATFTYVAAAPGANEFSSIAELEILVEAEASINSSQADGVVTINADAIGTAGNAITLAVGVGNTGTMAVSGATLTGGVDQTYTDWYELEDEAEAVYSVAYVDAVAGTAPTIDITSQISIDQDGDAFAQFITTGNKQLTVMPVKRFFRFKIVLGGTSPLATIRLHSEPREVDTDDAATVAILTDIDTQVTAIKVSGQIIDDWDESDRAKVNPIAGQAGVAAGAGAVSALTQRTTLASDDPAVASLGIMDDWDNTASDGASVSGDVAHDAVDAGEPIKTGGKARTARPAAVSDGDRVNAYYNEYGDLNVSLDTGLNETDDKVAAMVSASATVPGFSTLWDADGDNTAQAVKVTAGNLYHLHIYNPNAAGVFVQLFDLATGSITVGTTAPKFVLFVPASGNTIADFDVPMSFLTAISYACTTTPTGNGDPTTGLSLSWGYK